MAIIMISLRKRRSCIVYTLSFLVLLCIFISCALLFMAGSYPSTYSVNALGETNPQNTQQVPYVQIAGQVSNIDPSAFNIKVHTLFYPKGSLASTNTKIPRDKARIPNQPFIVGLDDQKYRFQKSIQTTSQDIVVSISEGEFSKYPFDEYKVDFTISAALLNGFSNNSNAINNTLGSIEETPIDIEYIFTTTLMGWEMTSMDNPFFRDEILGQVQVEMKFSRSLTVKGFSLFISITMWLLSLTMFFATVSIWARGRKVESPFIGVSASMVFALPAIRNSAFPGAPPIGSSLDLLGFFWNMLLVTIALWLNLMNYYYTTKNLKNKRSNLIENEMINKA